MGDQNVSDRATFLAEVVSEVGTGVAAYDRDGVIQYANERYAEMLDTTVSDLEGNHITRVNPDFDRERFDGYWESFAAGETRRTDTVHRALDGDREFPVNVTTTQTSIGGRPYHVGTVVDITERREYERRLEAQRDDLKILNQVVRHDIRNDLQIIQAYLELLGDHVDAEGREYFTTVRESTGHAADLTTTARELSEVMLQTEATKRRIALDRALEEELEEVRSAHPEAVMTIADSLPDADVVADDMLGAVFRNLLTNAVQHNDATPPEVTLAADRQQGCIEVRIADNGPGVPDSQKESIFGKGEKGLESAGTGLGLYLVQTLVNGYDGEIWVEDNDPEGAVFVVQLPTVD